ncbi:MAG: zeta toxin family protein [Zetaproteobacteria bacterium]|nr:zeta toxin family protein [Zetaproteobacteria bacterium]
MIKKPTYLGLISFILVSFARAQSTSDTPTTFYACVQQDMKWDFASQQCSPGRLWISASEQLKKIIDRPYRTEELDTIVTVMGGENKHTIATGEAPQAVMILGAPGSGKSTLAGQQLSKWFPHLQHTQFVLFDGDILREYHQGYQQSTVDPHIGYSENMQLIKPHVAKAKAELLAKFTSEHRHLILTTVEHGPKYLQLLKAHHYHIHLLGVYAEFEESHARGLNRAQWSGRYHLGGEQKWRRNLADIHRLSIHPDIHHAVILNNTNFNHPFLVKRTSQHSTNDS